MPKLNQKNRAQHGMPFRMDGTRHRSKAFKLPPKNKKTPEELRAMLAAQQAIPPYHIKGLNRVGAPIDIKVQDWDACLELPVVQGQVTKITKNGIILFAEITNGNFSITPAGKIEGIYQ